MKVAITVLIAEFQIKFNPGDSPLVDPQNNLIRVMIDRDQAVTQGY